MEGLEELPELREVYSGGGGGVAEEEEEELL